MTKKKHLEYLNLIHEPLNKGSTCNVSKKVSELSMDTFIFGNQPHFNIYFSDFNLNLSYYPPVLSEQSPQENDGGFDPMTEQF